MTVIAQEGRWYLIDVGGGLGRVLDLEFNRFFPPRALASLLAKGAWSAFSGDSAAVIASIADAQDLSPEATAGGRYAHA